jgi:ABC-type multidrug transport system ATPase subunit
LHASEAAFVRDGKMLVAPFSVDVERGARAVLAFDGSTGAAIAARMAAGIVKPTSGTLLVWEFDPRIQPVQAKRLAGFVPQDGDYGDRLTVMKNSATSARRKATIELHAALFEIPSGEAHRRVSAVLEQLGRSDSVAFAVALALIRPVALLVLDRPPADLGASLAGGLGGQTAIVSTMANVPLAAPVLTAP